MISRYVIYFSLMSVIGYVYECLAMILWTGKWDNRGFLFGPAIPIYGGCALAGTILFEHFYTSYTPLYVFLISVFASAAVEYVVHYELEKIFHAYWWDYSKSPFNINGRICLPASIGFGIAGLIVVYVINPAVLPLIFELKDTTTDIISLICTIIFTADLTLTLSVLSSFTTMVENMDNYINDHMDVLIGNITNESKGIGKHFYSAVDKIEEKKKRLLDDRIERAANSMNVLYHGVLLKVKGFRGKHSVSKNAILRRIKEKINRNKDE